MPTNFNILSVTFWILFTCVGKSSIALGDNFEYQSVLTLPTALKDQPSVFKNTTDLAFGPDGSGWVASIYPHSVQRFNAQGGYQGKFIADLYKITVAPDGSFWGLAGDFLYSNSIVAKHYSAQGQLIQQFNLYNGFLGSSSTDIASAADGSVWIMTNGNLNHFSADGNQLGRISTQDDGTTSTWSSFGLAADGNLWINSDKHLMHYQPDGRLLASINKTDNLKIRDIAVAKDGSLWLAGIDAGFYHLKTDGKLIAKFTANLGNPANPSSLSIAPDGSVWMVGKKFVQQLQTDGQIRFHSSGAFQPVSPIADPDGSLWLADNNNQTIQHLNARGQLLNPPLPVSECLPNKRYAQDTMDYDRKLALAPDGTVWVVDNYTTRISPINLDKKIDSCFRHIDRKGKPLQAFSLTHTVNEDDQEWGYSAFAITPEGLLCIVNARENRIEYFSPAGIKQREILGGAIDKNTGHFGFSDIINLKVAHDGSLWLIHNHNNRDKIQHLDTQGRIIDQFQGGLLLPRYTKLALAKDGSVWLANPYGGAIEHVNAQGDYLEQIDVPDSYTNYYHLDGTFEIAATADGGIWLADTIELIQITEAFRLPRLQKFQANAASTDVANFDAHNNWAILRDIEAEGKHFRATLKQDQDDRLSESYKLVTLNPAKHGYSPAGHYDTSTGLLSIPKIKVGDQDYRSVLLQGGPNNFGQWEFRLKNANRIQ